MYSSASPENKQFIQEVIDIGTRQLQRGHFTEYDEESLKERFERIKSEGRQRLETSTRRR